MLGEQVSIGQRLCTPGSLRPTVAPSASAQARPTVAALTLHGSLRRGVDERIRRYPRS
jgi:hypothetical protein